MKTCSSCGKSFPNDFQFCPACGSKQNPAPPSLPKAARCPSCGAAIQNSDTQFCASCGALLSKSSNAPALKKRRSSNSPYAHDNSFTKAKAPRSPLVFILPSVAGILLIAGILIAIFFPALQRQIMGDAQYYLYQESKNLSNLLAPENFDLRDTESFSATSQIKVEAGQGAEDYVGLEEMISAFSGSTTLNYDAKGQDAAFTADVFSNNNTILNIEADRFDNQFIFKSEMTKVSLVLDATAEQGGDLQTALLDVVNKLCDEHLNPAISHDKRGYFGEKCDAYTLEMTYEQILSAYAFLLEECQNNETLAAYYADLSVEEFGYNNASEMFDELQSELQATLAADDPANDQVVFSYTVLFNGSGKILCRELNIKDSENQEENYYTVTIESDITSKNARIDFSLASIDESSTLNATFSRTYQGDKMSFRLDVDWVDEEIELSVSGKDLEWKPIGGVPAILGTFSLSFDEYEEPYMDLSLTAKESSGVYKITCNAALEGVSDLFTIAATTSLSPDVQLIGLSVPENSTDDVATFMAELETAFEDAMEKAFSDDYMDDDYEDSYYDSYYDENGYSYSYGSGYDPIASGYNNYLY